MRYITIIVKNQIQRLPGNRNVYKQQADAVGQITNRLDNKEIDNFKFVTKVFAMKGIKIELLGIAIIPLEIAVTTNNFWGYVLGVLGFGVAVVGCFLKDNH